MSNVETLSPSQEDVPSVPVDSVSSPLNSNPRSFFISYLVKFLSLLLSLLFMCCDRGSGSGFSDEDFQQFVESETSSVKAYISSITQQENDIEECVGGLGRKTEEDQKRSLEEIYLKIARCRKDLDIAREKINVLKTQGIFFDEDRKDSTCILGTRVETLYGCFYVLEKKVVDEFNKDLSNGQPHKGFLRHC